MLSKVLVTVIQCFLLFELRVCLGDYCPVEKDEYKMKVFAIVVDEDDGYQRFMRSTKYNGMDVDLLRSQIPEGPYSKREYEIKLLLSALESLKSDDTIVMILNDSSNTITTCGISDIKKKFMNTKANILISVGDWVSLDTEMMDNNKLLDSGMLIGYASHIYKLLEILLEEEQCVVPYFRNIINNKTLQIEYGLQFDTTSEIFQNLNEDVNLDVNNESLEGTLRNVKYMTNPCVIRGSGSQRVRLNSVANYLGGTFKNGKCLICEENLITNTEKDLPTILFTIFVVKAVPFFGEFLEKIQLINYPKDRMDLFIYCNVKYHEYEVKEFAKNTTQLYKSVKLISLNDKVEELDARKLSIEEAIRKKSEYVFSINSDVHLDDSNILRDLLKYNQSFIAPVLTFTEYNYGNFWGALSRKGLFAKSHDYLNITNWKIRGMWNVPCVSTGYLVKKSVLEKMNFDHYKFGPDMALCESLRNEGVFMNIINIKKYGHLVDSDDFDPNLIRPDFYMLISNQLDWEKRYIHSNYSQQLQANFTHKQPCPDVYWFPIVTERFCKDLLAIMEEYGKWSDGSSNDPRLDGGYEAVPTRDIHMTQVGLQDMWLYFLKEYVRPLKDVVYNDSDTTDPRSQMNFVVRYRPDEQPSLKPHFDTSTYTINIALNRVDVDYKGGGCKFLRYNCSVTDTKMGWMLMHPGRLTHLHEGLTVTNGTRYIMVSFIDP